MIYRKITLSRTNFKDPFKTVFFNFLPPYGELSGEISTQCAGILDAPRAIFFQNRLNNFLKIPEKLIFGNKSTDSFVKILLPILKVRDFYFKMVGFHF